MNPHLQVYTCTELNVKGIGGVEV